MQVKKFEAATMQEALKVIKRELGPDAIILSTKHLKSGFGLMSKASVEVTAAVAEKDLKKKKMAEKDLPQNVKEKIWNSKAEKQSEIYDTYFEKQLKRANKDRVEIAEASRRAKEPAPIQQTQSRQITDDQRAAAAINAQRQAQRQQQQSVRQQIIETEQPRYAASPAQASSPATAVRERRYIDISDEESPAQARASIVNTGGESSSSDTKVRSLEKDIEQLKSMIGELASGASGREESDPDLSEELVRAMHDLANQGIEKKFARAIVRQVSFDLTPEERANEGAIMDKIAYYLMEGVKVRDLLDHVGAVAGKSTSTAVALVGPTGVGKTTTIAKIASLGILEKRLRVGLINLDSYKVAAADQLATYAKIMNVPFRSVTTREELQQAVYDFASLDLVLIDTTGRSQKDQESLLQLRHMLASIEGVQTALLVSATTKDTDITEVVTRFKIFNPVGLVFSKLDETSLYGCIYNVHKRSGLPLLYFTVGQRVPEDIEKASAERIADLVLDL
ncbi:MAG: flagellar biosynthesis protein FlhF [Bacteriovoracia bacterium]